MLYCISDAEGSVSFAENSIQLNGSNAGVDGKLAREHSPDMSVGSLRQAEYGQAERTKGAMDTADPSVCISSAQRLWDSLHPWKNAELLAHKYS